MPPTISVSDIQRNYKSLIGLVNRTRKPVVLLRRNKPVGVVIDMDSFEALRKAERRWEEEDTRRAVAVAKKELKQGKLKLLKGSLGDLMDEKDEN